MPRRLSQLWIEWLLFVLLPALAFGQTVRKETVIWDFVNGLRVRGVPIGAAGASGADQVFVSDAPGAGTWRTLPHAPGGIGYDTTTNAFQAVTIGVSSGIVSTIQLSDGTSGFVSYLGTLCEPGLVMRGLTALGKADCDINGGIAPATVQALLNTHVLLDRTESIFPNGIALGALPGGILLSTVTDGVAVVSTLPAPTGALVGTTATQTLRNKRIVPRSCPLPIDDATLTIDVDNCEVAVLSDLLQDTQFMTPEGTAEEGDTLRMRVHATIPRAITWAAGWSPLGGAPLPAVLVGDAVWYFQYNASLGWVFLLNSKFIDALLVSGVTPGTYNCPRDLAVGMDGRITSLVEGECAGGGGGSATAAGVAGDVQFKGTGSNLAAASNGGFTFDSGNQTLGLQNLQTASAGGYYSFTDVYGNLGYLWGPQMSAPRVWSLPDESGRLCSTGSVCSGYQAALANPVTGTGTTGQLATWASSTAVGAGNLSGAVTTSGSTVTSMSAPFRVKSCLVTIGNAGAEEPVLANDNDAQEGCLNDFGVGWTITAVSCKADTTTGTPQIDVKQSTTGGSSILTGAVSCGTSLTAGTLSGTPVINSYSGSGQATCSSAPCNLAIDITPGGTVKEITVKIVGTIPAS